MTKGLEARLTKLEDAMAEDALITYDVVNCLEDNAETERLKQKAWQDYLDGGGTCSYDRALFVRINKYMA